MDSIKDLFFILLRSAIWGTKTVLPRIPNKEEWNEIARLSKEQTVIGIMLDAIAMLPERQKPHKELLLQWIMQQKIIEKQNIRTNSVIKEVFNGLQSNGIRAFLLKGQGVAQNYIHPLHRQSGDIDIYFTKRHFDNAYAYFKSLGCKLTEEPIHFQIATAYKSITIELHKQNAAYYTKRLERCYNEITGAIINNEKAYVIIDDIEIEVLPYMADAFQLLSHMKRHIYSSGIALRQICDWLCFVYHHQKKFNKELFIKNMKVLQLYEIYKTAMIISTDYLGLPKDYILCNITSKDRILAKKVLNLIIAYGNFGRYRKDKTTNTKWEYIKAYIWKVKNCIRFRRIAGNDAWNFPIWQLHSIKKFIK